MVTMQELIEANSIDGSIYDRRKSPWKQLVIAWRKDCQRYEKALKDARCAIEEIKDKFDFPHDPIINIINDALTQNDNCNICGDYHDSDNTPISCETGDGI